MPPPAPNHRVSTLSPGSSLANPAAREALLAVHRSEDLKNLWPAMVRLVKASLPCFHLIAAFPFDGPVPKTLRTTLPEPDPEEFWLRLQAANPPMAKVLASRPGVRVSYIDQEVPERELLESRFYREIMVPGGWRYSCGLFFWNSKELLAHIKVTRTREQGRFLEEEKPIFEELHAHLETVLLRVARGRAQTSENEILRQALEEVPDGSVLLDSQLETIHHNGAAAVACELWKGSNGMAMKPPAASHPGLPVGVLAVATRLLENFQAASRERRIPAPSNEEVVKHPSIPGLAAKITVIPPRRRGTSPHIRVTFSRVTPWANLASPVFLLSDAERRVAELVAEGYRNEGVAAKLGVSVHTIRAHLRQVFCKLEIRHRGQLSSIFHPR